MTRMRDIMKFVALTNSKNIQCLFVYDEDVIADTNPIARDISIMSQLTLFYARLPMNLHTPHVCDKVLPSSHT